jgi:hypothetical protein
MTQGPDTTREENALHPRFALVMLGVGVLTLSMAFAGVGDERGVPFVLGIGCMGSALWELTKGNRVAYAIWSALRALTTVIAWAGAIAAVYWMFPGLYNASSVRAVVVIAAALLTFRAVRAMTQR